jgi:hypothetical protein
MTFPKADPTWKILMTFCNNADMRARFLGAERARIAASVDRRRGRPFTSPMSGLHVRAPVQH